MDVHVRFCDSRDIKAVGILAGLVMPWGPVSGRNVGYFVIGHLLMNYFFLKCVWKRTRSCDMMPGILVSVSDALGGYCCCKCYLIENSQAVKKSVRPSKRLW